MSNNLQLLPKASREPAFLIILRILIAIAILQVIASMIVFAPRLITGIKDQLAARIKRNDPILLPTNKNKNRAMVESFSATPSKPAEVESAAEQLILSHKSSPTLQTHEPSTITTSSGDGALPQGAALGIINVQHSTGPEEEQILKIGIKSRPQEAISVPEVKVQVYFYDEQDGEIVASKAPVASRWLSPPVDWKDGEPELLEVTYQPDNNNANAHYIGYIVAIYYKGELQSYRANPVKLTTQFPIKVYIGGNDL
ncbi:MAG: hypothetical protein ACH346_04945 [Chthoniobacterales bacterium]